MVGGRHLRRRLLRRHDLGEGAEELVRHRPNGSTTEVRRLCRRIPPRLRRAHRGGRRRRRCCRRGAKERVYNQGPGVGIGLAVQRPCLEQQRVLRQELRWVGRHCDRREQARSRGRRREPRRGLVPAGKRGSPPRRGLALGDPRVSSSHRSSSVSGGVRGLWPSFVVGPATWRASLRHVVENADWVELVGDDVFTSWGFDLSPLSSAPHKRNNKRQPSASTGTVVGFPVALIVN